MRAISPVPVIFSKAVLLMHQNECMWSKWSMTMGKKPFKNIVGKEENAGNQNFFLFPHCFLPYKRKKCAILALLKSFSANAFNLD